MKNRAVFLDRDGTIIEDRNYVYRIEDFCPLKNSVEGLKMMMDMGYLLVIISNQSGIARGLFSESHLNQFFHYFNDYFNSRGVYFSGIYYCPHHPQGKIEPYKKDCDCRKPGTGLFLQAAAELEIEPALSYAIGDSLRDIAAGNRIKANTILITGKTEAEYRDYQEKPDFTARDLLDSAFIIKNNSLQ